MFLFINDLTTPKDNENSVCNWSFLCRAGSEHNPKISGRQRFPKRKASGDTMCRRHRHYNGGRQRDCTPESRLLLRTGTNGRCMSPLSHHGSTHLSEGRTWLETFIEGELRLSQYTTVLGRMLRLLEGLKCHWQVSKINKWMSKKEKHNMGIFYLSCWEVVELLVWKNTITGSW